MSVEWELWVDPASTDTDEAKEVARSLAIGEIPQWLYVEYREDGTDTNVLSSENTLDLDGLWQGVRQTPDKDPLDL